MKKSKGLLPSLIYNFIKLVFNWYHILFPSTQRICRFNPTCSEYFLESVEKHGTLRGLVLSIKRLLSCHPFSKKSPFDPVPL